MSTDTPTDNNSVGQTTLEQPPTTSRTVVVDVVADHLSLADYRVFSETLRASEETIHRVRP